MVKKPPAGDRDIDHVLETLDCYGVDAARYAYAEQFGVAHDDAEIDRKIERLFNQSFHPEPPLFKVEVPVSLLLALTLREGFAGRSSGVTKKIKNKLFKFRQLVKARVLKEQYKKKKGMTALQAENDVVDYCKQSDRYTVSESEIRKSFKNGGVYGKHAKSLMRQRKR